MRFISWNVNGLRACEGKGFSDIFRQLDADFFCIQETKMQAGQLDLYFERYQSFWNYADKKGYSGTAVFTRHTPLNVNYGIGIDEHDHEGRVITLEMDDFFLVNVYVPNSQDELKRLDYRMRWEDDFLNFVKSLDRKKTVIVCGDLNVAHQEIDLKNPKGNRRNPGFTNEERGKFGTWLAAGFPDTLRISSCALNPLRNRLKSGKDSRSNQCEAKDPLKCSGCRHTSPVNQIQDNGYNRPDNNMPDIDIRSRQRVQRLSCFQLWKQNPENINDIDCFPWNDRDKRSKRCPS